jgi:hypothetical protein
MESEILMYVVARAAEPTGTTITMASDQGDLMCVRFVSDEHLSDLYEIGDETMDTVAPARYHARMTASIERLHPPGFGGR